MGKLASELRSLTAGALDEEEVVLDVGGDTALLEQIERANLKFCDRRWRRCQRRTVVLTGAEGMHRSGGADEVGFVIGEGEVTRQEGLDNGLLILAWYKDKIRIVGGNEKNGNTGKSQRRRQLHNTARRVHACANDGENEVVILGYRDGLGEFLWEVLYRGLKDVFGPGAVADNGALHRSDANIEEAMLAVGIEALQLMFGLTLGRLEGLGLREKDAEDGLQQGRV